MIKQHEPGRFTSGVLAVVVHVAFVACGRLQRDVSQSRWNHRDDAHGQQAGQRQGATLFMSLLAVFAVRAVHTAVFGAVLAGALVTEVVFNYPGVGSLEAGERYIDWKPDVCWQLPIRVDWEPRDDGTEVATVRRCC